MFCTDLEQIGFIPEGDADFPYRSTQPNLVCSSDESHDSSTVIAHWHSDENEPFFYCQKHGHLKNPDVLKRAADGAYSAFVRHWPSFNALKSFPMWIWSEATKHGKHGMSLTVEGADGDLIEACYLYSHPSSTCVILAPEGETDITRLPIIGGVERHVSRKRDSQGLLRKFKRQIMPIATYEGLPASWEKSGAAGSKVLRGLVFTYTDLRLVCLDFDAKGLEKPIEHYLEGEGEPELTQVLQALRRNGAIFERSTSGLGLHAYFLVSDIEVWRQLKFSLKPKGLKWSVDVFRGGRAGWVAVTEDWIQDYDLGQQLPVLSADLLNQFQFLVEDFKKAVNSQKPEKPWRPRVAELHTLLEERGWHLFIDEISDVPYIDTSDEEFLSKFYEERVYRSNAFHMAGIDPLGPQPLTEHHRAWMYSKLVADMNIALPVNFEKLFRDVATMNPQRNLIVDYLVRCYNDYDATEGFDYYVLPELYHLPEGHERHSEIWRTAVRGMAQRILTPGSYVGTVVCLAGDIGLNKSALFQLMMPPNRTPVAKKLPKELFARNVYDRQKKMGEAMIGASLIEIEEINTIFRSGYDQSQFMDDILRETATYRKSHRTDAQDHPMQAAYVGSLNLSREWEPFIPTNVPGYLRRLYIIFIEGERPKLPIKEFKDWWVEHRDRFWGSVMHDLLDLEFPFYPTTDMEKDFIIPETRKYTDLLGEPATEFLFERHIQGMIEGFQRRELYDLYSETGDGKNTRIGAARFGEIITSLGYGIENKRMPKMDNPDEKEQRRVYVFKEKTKKLIELEELYGATLDEYSPAGELTDAELEVLGDE